MGVEAPNEEALLAELQGYKDVLGTYICDTTQMMWEIMDADKKILLEGAQGTMLDIDHGTYPYVTSSTTVSAGACSGLGINPKDIALIVEIIMAQMNSGSEPTLEEQLVHAQEQKMVKQDLKDINHYNKVVIDSNIEQEQSSELMKLRDNLNTMMEESTQTNNSSNYSKAIEKEIAVRSNEMKIIIVQKGDTLSKIAEKAYGDKNAYPKIFIANPEVLKNPNEIFIGQKLRIPS